MKLKKGPAPKPAHGFAGISPTGEISVFTVRSTAKAVRDHLGSHFRGGWKGAKREGWRTCSVAIAPLGFEVYRGSR